MDITILVPSNDTYEEIWDPFFKLLINKWDSLPGNTFLITESKKYEDDTNNIYTLNTGVAAWGERLLTALSNVETKYVLLILDDFFLLSEVKYDLYINYILTFFKEYNGSVLYFNQIPNFEIKFHDYLLPNEVREYFCNSQVGIWRKEVLISAILPTDTIWDFELNGHKRLNKGEIFATLGRQFHNKIFNYRYLPKDGYGVSRGIWLWKNDFLMKKHGIKVDLNNLIKITFSGRLQIRISYYVLKLKSSIKRMMEKQNWLLK